MTDCTCPVHPARDPLVEPKVGDVIVIPELGSYGNPLVCTISKVTAREIAFDHVEGGGMVRPKHWELFAEGSRVDKVAP